MRLGILKSGNLSDEMATKYGQYPEVFARFFHDVAPQADVFSVDVNGGEPLPAAATIADGWLITGSRHGAYEDHGWIPPLKAFIREIVAARVPLVGVCFGHQIIADALGGRTEKHVGGWGLGVHSYAPVDVPEWMGGFARPWTGHAMHQDQVVDLPPTAQVLATSPFCRHAALLYGDPERPDAISVQSHPEMSDQFVRDLIETRMQHIIPKPVVDRALQDLGAPVTGREWAEVFIDYIRGGRAGQSAGGPSPGKTVDTG